MIGGAGPGYPRMRFETLSDMPGNARQGQPVKRGYAGRTRRPPAGGKQARIPGKAASFRKLVKLARRMPRPLNRDCISLKRKGERRSMRIRSRSRLPETWPGFAYGSLATYWASPSSRRCGYVGCFPPASRRPAGPGNGNRRLGGGKGRPAFPPACPRLDWATDLGIPKPMDIIQTESGAPCEILAALV
jgi:hypothetical protein